MQNSASTAPKGFGMHLMVDLEGCDEVRLQDLRVAHDVLLTLCARLAMKQLTQPYAFVYDGGDNPRGKGVTGVLIIAESHISLHTFPYMRHVFADVFSCKPFDAEQATMCLAATFGSTVYSSRVVDRGLNFKWN